MKKIDKKNQNKILIIFTLVMLALDQILKIFFYSKGMDIAKTSSEESNNGYNIVMSILIIFMIIRYISNDNTFIKFNTKVVLCFAIAGAAGNAIDRIWNNQVINFIKIGNYLELNLAYIYILITWIGMAVILTKNSMEFIKMRKAKKEKLDEFEKNSSKK